jgi:hypothetical protein
MGAEFEFWSTTDLDEHLNTMSPGMWEISIFGDGEIVRRCKTELEELIVSLFNLKAFSQIRCSISSRPRPRVN